MEYITDTLGIKVSRKKWSESKKLPYFLLDEYSFEAVTLDKTECLFVKPKQNTAIINTLKKHLAAIKKQCNKPIVLELNTMTRQKRKSFVENKISFVVENKQIYLPFLGIALQESFDSEISSVKNLEELLPSAQMILFSFIYQKCKPLYLSEITKTSNLSAMSVTRAANQLTDFELLKVKTEGRLKILYSELSPKEMFFKAKSYFTNPIRKTVYINKNQVESDMFPTGLSALSKMSMLNPPSVDIYGTTAPIKDIEFSETLFDTDKQCKLEFWKYNPITVSGEKCADILSLAVCFGDSDERVQTEIEKILNEKVW